MSEGKKFLRWCINLIFFMGIYFFSMFIFDSDKEYVIFLLLSYYLVTLKTDVEILQEENKNLKDNGEKH